ncbi:MAG: hypothetical protein HGA22_11900, partial [Clostridiales bacterium]|nr:hypothetical protein [Clostridiales bacterium]
PAGLRAAAGNFPRSHFNATDTRREPDGQKRAENEERMDRIGLSPVPRVENDGRGILMMDADMATRTYSAPVGTTVDSASPAAGTGTTVA